MKTEKKFYATDYQITTPYFINDIPTKIMVASDIHYQKNVSRDIFRMLVKYAQETKPDFIVMPGDQIETIDFIDETSNKEFFESIIRELSEIAPVIMIPGNHEIKNFSKENFKNRLTTDNTINIKALKYFESLNKIKNVYFLNNEQVTFNGATFLGFSPRLSSYQKINDQRTEEEFIEDYLKSGLKMAQADYNILLTHSPLQITSNGVFNSICDFGNLTDLVITGHFHDGYLPKKLDGLFGKTNAGLFFTPLVAPYPGIICRGVHDFGRGYLFISQGYRKWTADISLFNAFEKITANDVENLILSNGSKNVLESPINKPFSR